MNLIDRCFTGKDILIIGPVFPQKLGDVQLVGTPGHTGAAVHALVDFGHFGLPMGREPVVRGGTADHLGHPGALVDLDLLGAGHTVPAPGTADLDFAVYDLDHALEQGLVGLGQLPRLGGGGVSGDAGEGGGGAVRFVDRGGKGVV